MESFLKGLYDLCDSLERSDDTLYFTDEDRQLDEAITDAVSDVLNSIRGYADAYLKDHGDKWMS